MRGAASAALDAVETALNARLEGSGTAVPELKRFLERIADHAGTRVDGAHAANGAAKPAETPAAPEAPVRNGHDMRPVGKRGGT